MPKISSQLSRALCVGVVSLGVLLGVVGAAAVAVDVAAVQTPAPQPKTPDPQPNPPPETPPAPPETPPAEPPSGSDAAARLKEISRLFSATEVKFAEDQQTVIITYDLSTSETMAGEDFSPPVEKTNNRIRWARDHEGYSTFVGRGIMIAEYGVWLHKAVWAQDVAMDVEFHYLSEIMKPRDIIAAVYAWDKGKRIVGSNVGRQCIKLSPDVKLSGPPIPEDAQIMRADEKRVFGFKLQHGVLAATVGGRKTVDTDSKPKFLSKPESGSVGLAWRGEYCKGAVTKITITGKLDKEWLAKQLAK
ncbi:MAG: hypothetical protein ACKVX7_16405 [Planctomycetota bacterium]